MLGEVERVVREVGVGLGMSLSRPRLGAWAQRDKDRVRDTLSIHLRLLVICPLRQVGDRGFWALGGLALEQHLLVDQERVLEWEVGLRRVLARQCEQD